MEELFSKGPSHKHKRTMGDEVRCFTAKEPKKALKRVKTSRASVIDGVPPETIKKASAIEPKWMLNTINSLLASQTFPKTDAYSEAEN